MQNHFGIYLKKFLPVEGRNDVKAVRTNYGSVHL